MGGLIFFVILAGGGLAIFEFNYIGRFYPGVVFAGMDIGGLSFEEVERRVTLGIEKFQSEGLILTVKASAANYLINIPMNIVGLSSDTVVSYFGFGDWHEELAKAYAFGRDGSIAKKSQEQLEALVLGQEVSLPYSIYEVPLNGLLNREFANILSEQRPASYKFNGSVWEVVPEKIGESIDVNEVISAVNKLFVDVKDNKLEVVVEKAIPATTKNSLSRHLDFVVNAVAPAELRFRYNGYSAYLSGWTLATWLEVDENKSGDFILRINKDKLEAFIRNKLGAYLENPMQNSRFAFSDGELIEISPGLAGNTIDFEKMAGELDFFLEDEYKKFVFPAIGEEVNRSFVFDIGVKKEEPKITKATIDQYKIKELVAKASTSFAGSGASRIHNIRLAASKLNGLLLAPGEEFSAVNGIGYVTEEEGYEKEYVIKGNESVKEIGGGLCQLATTLFRMTIDGGLPITERQNHSYVVGYYGPGLDATIYGPHPDFRFVNDTGNYLLLQSKADGTNLVFELYGQKDGRVSSISEPEVYDRIPPPEPRYVASYELPLGATKCTETARYGMTTEATYTVEYADGNVVEKVFKSVYRPWQKVCLVGIKTY